MYFIYHGFIKTKEMKLMVKRVLSVVGVFFLYFLVMFIGTMGFQFLVEGRFSLTEYQLFHYSGTFGIAVVALFAVWFNHVKGISTDLDSRKDRSFIKMIVVAVFSVCIGTILFDSFVGFLLNGILPITEDVALDKTAFDYIVAILIGFDILLHIHTDPEVFLISFYI